MKADINRTLKLLALLEYSNKPHKFLHKNKHENTFTCGGVYAYANPKVLDFEFIDNVVESCYGDVKRASTMLYHDTTLRTEIREFCKKDIWDKMRLDEVSSQKIADELFLFAFHTHYITAAKVAQRVVGVKADGFIGPMSLKALNSFDVDTFDMIYDEREKEHYQAIVDRRPYLQENYKGWEARANRV